MEARSCPVECQVSDRGVGSAYVSGAAAGANQDIGGTSEVDALPAEHDERERTAI